MIPYGRQQITQADVEAVTRALQSELITQGPLVPQFEQAVASRVGASYGVAANSGTSALHIACKALDLGPGDRLWTAPNTFVASANCGLYCGASVGFVDIDPATGNMDPSLLEAALKDAARRNLLPKVVVPVHFAGQPGDQERIWNLGREFGFRIVEDAAHSIGATRHGVPVGSCRWSDITVFSFHPVKTITTIEGGIALTNDPDLSRRMSLLRSHGITRDPAFFVDTPADGSHYEQLMLGWNYRLTDIAAALGLSQLQRLEDFVDRRRRLAARYDDMLKNLPVEPISVDAGSSSARHLYVIRVPGRGPELRARLLTRMRAAGIGVNVHYRPVHLQPYWRQFGFKQGDFPNAESHGQHALTLPLYPELDHDQQDYVVRTLAELLNSEPAS